jgi:hypothetical protein
VDNELANKKAADPGEGSAALESRSDGVSDREPPRRGPLVATTGVRRRDHVLLLRVERCELEAVHTNCVRNCDGLVLCRIACRCIHYCRIDGCCSRRTPHSGSGHAAALEPGHGDARSKRHSVIYGPHHGSPPSALGLRPLGRAMTNSYQSAGYGQLCDPGNVFIGHLFAVVTAAESTRLSSTRPPSARRCTARVPQRRKR